MEKLKELEEEMFLAKQIYETFMKENSTKFDGIPIFGGLIAYDTRMLNLTKEQSEDMKLYELNMKKTHENYLNYLKETTK